MPFAMDDFSRSYGVDPTLQTRLIEETRTTEKTADVKTTDSEKKESAVDDVFESSPQKPDPEKDSVQKIQEKSTSIDIVNESLNKINSYIKDIKSKVESGNSDDANRKRIEEDYKKIKQVAKESTFNDRQLIQTEEANSDDKDAIVSDKELKLSDIKSIEIDTSAHREDAVKKLDGLMDAIKQKQQALADAQKEFTVNVNQNSLIEIKRISSEEEKEEEISAEKLKETAIKSIKENPEESRRIQIKHLDKNLLLAMISLRGA